MTEGHELSDHDRAVIAMHYDRMMELLAKRHGITEQQLIESIHWVQRHKEWLESMKKAGWISLIGFLLSAAILAFWEGFKQAVRGGARGD